MDDCRVIVLRSHRGRFLHIAFNPRIVQSGSRIMSLCHKYGTIGKPNRYLGSNGLFWVEHRITSISELLAENGDGERTGPCAECMSIVCGTLSQRLYALNDATKDDKEMIEC